MNNIIPPFTYYNVVVKTTDLFYYNIIFSYYNFAIQNVSVKLGHSTLYLLSSVVYSNESSVAENSRIKQSFMHRHLHFICHFFRP